MRKHCCLTDYYGLDTYHKHPLNLYIENGANKTMMMSKLINTIICLSITIMMT